MSNLNLEFHPLTADYWPHFATLFGEKGGYAGCWCMFWRIERATFKAQKYEGNKDQMRHLIYSGEIPGILAFSGNQPMAWCGIGPREKYHALENSRILKRVDEQAVWSITCFFVTKPFRRKGVMQSLLSAAIEYGKAEGAKIIEGYPIDLQTEFQTPGGYMGVASAFRSIGFKEVGRASETQLIMRYMIEGCASSD